MYQISTSDNSAVKTAASDTKSAFSYETLRERGLGVLTRVGGFCSISGGFNRW